VSKGLRRVGLRVSRQCNGDDFIVVPKEEIGERVVQGGDESEQARRDKAGKGETGGDEAPSRLRAGINVLVVIR
jgi:hypothetical protein